jgi:hypothetical protein
MSTDIAPTTTAPAQLEEGAKKPTGAVNHEEYGHETEMEDLSKPADEQQVDVTPEDVSTSCVRSFVIVAE